METAGDNRLPVLAAEIRKAHAAAADTLSPTAIEKPRPVGAPKN